MSDEMDCFADIARHHIFDEIFRSFLCKQDVLLQLKFLLTGQDHFQHRRKLPVYVPNSNRHLRPLQLLDRLGLVNRMTVPLEDVGNI